MDNDIKLFHGKEILFYLVILLILIFAFLKRAFPKYFNDLFRVFFRSTLKQRQIKEQLIQTPFPSILLNGFFVVSGGLYIAFLVQHYQLDPDSSFWLIFVYGTLLLSLIYLVKFCALKVSGWLFSMQEEADSYIFIVFVINKMLGIFLIPFLVLLAFAQGGLYTTGITLSWMAVGAMYVYRGILTYSAIRNQVKVNPFHFFLWLLAFEIAPLLLIYKGLLLFFRISA
ncbi:MAG TPA: DUF4271 domain-containing protein [Chitinophagaceae bacterium]|nr:DUF4271 domain-containing protein [Chitinophagaceae bacterium]